MAPPLKQNVINHVVFVLDASDSMKLHKDELIRVADTEIQHLAQRSKEMEQETRVTIYTFSYAHTIKCVIFDMDVLRLPSIAELYRTSGMTALASATTLAMDDLAQTFQKYGDHAFLVYVLTDGIENESPYSVRTELPRKIAKLPENWTLGFLVPNEQGVKYAVENKISRENVVVWDATDYQEGMADVGNVLRQATDRWMQGRESGVRGTRNVFSTDATTVNAQTIQQAKLTPLAQGSYMLVPVASEQHDWQIRDFVNHCGHDYRAGMAYYQLSSTRKTKIQANKKIAVVDKKTAKVYTGDEARALVGLPGHEVSVKSDYNAEFDIFVQSTSTNRKLKTGTRLLLTGIK